MPERHVVDFNFERGTATIYKIGRHNTYLDMPYKTTIHVIGARPSSVISTRVPTTFGPVTADIAWVSRGEFNEVACAGMIVYGHGPALESWVINNIARMRAHFASLE